MNEIYQLMQEEEAETEGLFYLALAKDNQKKIEAVIKYLGCEVVEKNDKYVLKSKN